jgi:FdhD protein
LKLEPAIEECEILRAEPDRVLVTTRDVLAREEPLEIRVRGQSVAVTMRTPGQDPELAAGFLVSEGIVRSREEIVEIAHCAAGENAHFGNILNVFLAADAEVDLAKLTRHVFGSSSCGLCGKATIESVRLQFGAVTSNIKIPRSRLISLPEKLLGKQRTFVRTGGLHAAGVFTAAGDAVCVREDVGRHNAVDKALGWAFLSGHFPLSDSVLMVSGRASFEIMQKALAAGIPIVAAVSAPSSLAVDFARENEQTLIGFLRGASFNVYSRPDRLTDG